MQFQTAFATLLLVASSVMAMPHAAAEMEERSAVLATLESRADCTRILPACNGGAVRGQTNCRCRAQIETCDLWNCPGPAPNVMVCGRQGTGCVWI